MINLTYFVNVRMYIVIVAKMYSKKLNSLKNSCLHLELLNDYNILNNICFSGIKEDLEKLTGNIKTLCFKY